MEFISARGDSMEKSNGRKLRNKEGRVKLFEPIGYKYLISVLLPRTLFRAAGPMKPWIKRFFSVEFSFQFSFYFPTENLGLK